MIAGSYVYTHSASGSERMILTLGDCDFQLSSMTLGLWDCLVECESKISEDGVGINCCNGN